MRRTMNHAMALISNVFQWMALAMVAVLLALITSITSAAEKGHQNVGETIDQKADQVVVYKEKRVMQLLYQGKAIRSYAISLGDSPKGHKQQEGDEKTPEGDYVIDWRNPNSSYHLSLHISYPNNQDKRNAKQKGVDPGGMIMIHGLPNKFGSAGAYFKGRDWTDGCIAVNDNEDMKEIWNLVPDGTPITIHP